MSEQYKIEEEEIENDSKKDKILLQKPSDIYGNSLQSPYDKQASYRYKQNGQHKQRVIGYSSNITETCSKDNKFNIITAVKTEPASVTDDKFFTKAIDRSKEILDNIQ